jgi:hypothetical protein
MRGKQPTTFLYLDIPRCSGLSEYLRCQSLKMLLMQLNILFKSTSAGAVSNFSRITCTRFSAVGVGCVHLVSLISSLEILKVFSRTLQHLRMALKLLLEIFLILFTECDCFLFLSKEAPALPSA